MFTGIVEERGTIQSVTPFADAARISVAGTIVLDGIHPGDSIAVNGICLTVVDILTGGFTADVMLETLTRTSLRGIEPGTPVNLERAARLDSRLGGHLVQGHVDGTGAIIAIEPAEHWTVIDIGLPAALTRYVAEKGSITVDGVSLTVATVNDKSFTVSLIPTTLEVTTLGSRAVGDPVNLEVDVIAKYVERLMGGPR